MPMGSPALPWTAVSVRFPIARKTSTACCRRASLLPRGDSVDRRIRMAVTSTAIALLSFASTASAQTLRIVATTSDLASLARSVAGELAQVDVMMPAGADPEAFEPRPSDLAKLRGASVIVRVGLGYDHWLDRAVQMRGDLD